MTLPDSIPLPSRGRWLGIDHGDKVIGLAVCDALWLTTRPLGLLQRTTREADFAAIQAIITKRDIHGVVVGWPLNPDYDDSQATQPTRASTVQRWASRLAAAISVPVYLWEEQFSTLEAERLLQEAELGQPDRIDDHAAAVILRGFIDVYRQQVTLPPPLKQR